VRVKFQPVRAGIERLAAHFSVRIAQAMRCAYIIPTVRENLYGGAVQDWAVRAFSQTMQDDFRLCRLKTCAGLVKTEPRGCN
jgi:hypothetical protein